MALRISSLTSKHLVHQITNCYRTTTPASSQVLTQYKRFKSISANDVLGKSPYEELQVDLDVNSSKDNPMKINAYGNERTIACVCDDMRFMTLKKGPPVKCKCGYWFQLVDASKFWVQGDPHHH